MQDESPEDLLAQFGISMVPHDDPVYSEGPLVILGQQDEEAVSNDERSNSDLALSQALLEAFARPITAEERAEAQRQLAEEAQGPRRWHPTGSVVWVAPRTPPSTQE